MQDIDFYSGKNLHKYPPRFESADPEFFTRSMKNISSDHDKNRKKASRLLFLISALCIISFTTGLIIGIKVTGEPDRELIDRHTYSAMTDISKKVTDLIQKENASSRVNIYPKNEFPFVIRVGEDFPETKTQEIAQYLSRKGHRIILSKNNQNFRVYVGPYKSKVDAENALQKIHAYNSDLVNKIKVIQRL